jgi:hypothetical protein
MIRHAKRTLSCVADNTRSKKPRLCNGIVDNAKEKSTTMDMVSASHLYNYMMNDPLVDWLKLRNRRGTRKSPVYTQSEGFTEFIMNRGVEFECELIKYINNNKVPVTSVSEYITEESLDETKKLMRQGTPLIHSAPVRNYRNGTQGVIDILIRSDFLSKLVDEPSLSKEEVEMSSPTLGKPYHYVVIDIKFSTLPLRADGVHLLNSGSYPAYKAQCLVYTEAVGLIQGFTAPHSFIMGRRWRLDKGGVIDHNETCLNRLGKISYNSVDIDYKRRTREAIKWVRDVRKLGHTWSVNPPTRLELYPNMCIDSGRWNCEKEKIADTIGEITNIWYVGVKNRDFAIERGVTSWRDSECTTKNMNINGVRAKTIDAILDINRQSVDIIRPSVIKSNLCDWRNECNELYVDFETMSDIFSEFSSLPEQPKTDIIFMIGIGWSDSGKWRYKNFICAKPTHEEEYRIMNEFVQFLSERGNPRVHYWHAEKTFWNSAESRQFDLAKGMNDTERMDLISEGWKNRKWSDLCKLFQEEPIVVKDCFKFGLKAIARAMRKHGMISAQNDSECGNGATAMIRAWKTYSDSEDPRNSNVMKDIMKYNEFDCKVLWEILTFLRKNH